MKHFPRTLPLLTALPLLLGVGITPASTLDVSHPDGQANLEVSKTVSIYLALEGQSVMDALRASGATSPETRRDIAQRQIAYLTKQHQAMEQNVRMLGGVVETSFKRLTNALQVRISPDRWDRLDQLPGVKRVELVPYYERALASAVPFVGADRLWDGAGISATGKSIRIGIIDTGIDYTHAHFGGSGDPQDYKDNDRTIIEPGTFPTEKVVGGWDFVGDEYTGYNAPVPDPDPLDCSREQEQYIAGGHGTHVAGIAAGNGVLADGTPFFGPYQASFPPSQFKIAPGVAPEALLYALKVFGCDGGTTMSSAAMEWAIDPDGDGDFSDRLDILNMSLGGSYGMQTETDAEIIRNLTEAGTLVVVAAGNDGNTFFVTGDPASHTEALSVAAVTDEVSFLSMKVESPPSVAGDVACVEGSFTKPLVETGAITGILHATIPAKACSALTNAEDLSGKIALMDRGDCYFVDKIKRAADAGAIAAVVINDVTDAPFSMGGTGTQGTIAGVMVSLADGSALRNAQDVTVILDPSNVVNNAEDADQMARFSSRGPRVSDGQLKPDVGAPGVAIDSAGVASGSQPRQNQGTSMACPMVAGAAALLREVHPEREPLDIKAMLMNSTAPLADKAGNLAPVSLAGAGRIQVDSAAQRDVLIAAAQPPGAISVSFGTLISFEPVSRTRDVVVRNLGNTDRSFDITITPTYDLPGTSVSVTPASVAVAAGQTETITVTLTVEPESLPLATPDPHTPAEVSFWGSATYPRHFITETGGHIVFLEPDADPSEALRVPFHATVRAADRRAANPVRRCKTDESAPLQIPIEGPTSHKEPVTSAFELAATHRTDLIPSSTDLVAVGVATNTASTESLAKSSVYFALVVSGEWTTPARGPMSAVGIGLDVDGDSSEDYVVFAEPLSREFYADVLTVTTYNLRTGRDVSRRYLNLMPRDQLNTEPFNNSVVILPVSLENLGLTESNASFQFRGFTQQSPYFRRDTTGWLEYDPTRPAIDTSRGGDEGAPFYSSPKPVVVHIDTEQNNELPDVLLLHHTNEQGMRYETVSLSTWQDAEPTDLVVEQSLPRLMDPGRTITAHWKISNAGPNLAYDVTVQGSVTGAESIGNVATTEGTCIVDDGIRCDLGDMEPGVTVEVEVELVTKHSVVTVEVKVEDGLSCETDFTNNTVSGTSTPEGSPPDLPEAGTSAPLAVEEYEPGGGCSCEVGRRASGSTGATALLLMGLGLALRKRRHAAR